MTTTTKPTQTATTILRVPVPREWSSALDHLAIDLRQSKQDMLRQAVLLLLQHFARGSGLGELNLPVTDVTDCTKETPK